MQLPALWLVTLVVLAMMTGGAQMTRSEEVFTNAFLVELKDRHGNDVANEVAKRNGFTNMGPLFNGAPTFLFNGASLHGVQHYNGLLDSAEESE